MPNIAKLALDYRLPDHFGEEFDGCLTLRTFLVEIDRRGIKEAEGFSGKRHFGNSGWQTYVSDTLLQAGLIDDESEYEALMEATLKELER